MLRSFDRVGFTGSRSLSVNFAPVALDLSVRLNRSARVALPVRVDVGDARGADWLIRHWIPSADVWSASAFGTGRNSFAARSAAMVRSLAFSRNSCLVGLPASACPAEIQPARDWSSGAPPSGTWSSLALAVGLVVPVFVVWCGAYRAPDLPAWPGTWEPVTKPDWFDPLGCPAFRFRPSFETHPLFAI